MQYHRKWETIVEVAENKLPYRRDNFLDAFVEVHILTIAEGSVLVWKGKSVIDQMHRILS